MTIKSKIMLAKAELAGSNLLDRQRSLLDESGGHPDGRSEDLDHKKYVEQVRILEKVLYTPERDLDETDPDVQRALQMCKIN